MGIFINNLFLEELITLTRIIKKKIFFELDPSKKIEVIFNQLRLDDIEEQDNPVNKLLTYVKKWIGLILISLKKVLNTHLTSQNV